MRRWAVWQLLYMSVFVFFPHSGPDGSCNLPHLLRFAAVGSCCNRAFLTNLNTGVASVSICDDQCFMEPLLQVVDTAVMSAPYRVSDSTCERASACATVLSALHAFSQFVLFALMNESKGTNCGVVTDHSWFIPMFVLVLRRWPCPSLNISAVVFIDWIPNPPLLVGSANISDTQVLIGRSSQFRTFVHTSESSRCSIHVIDMLYVFSMKLIRVGMYVRRIFSFDCARRNCNFDVISNTQCKRSNNLVLANSLSITKLESYA